MEGNKRLSAAAAAPGSVAAASVVHEEAMTTTTMPMEQMMKEEAAAAEEQQQQQRGWMRGTTTALAAWTQWASIKSKARAAGEYTVLRTRQGITMFGEPKLGPLVTAAAASDESE
jgi:hypothetical protein